MKSRDILKVKKALVKSALYCVTVRTVGSVAHFVTLQQITLRCNTLCATHGRCGAPVTRRQHVHWKFACMSLLLAVSPGATCE